MWVSWAHNIIIVASIYHKLYSFSYYSIIMYSILYFAKLIRKTKDNTVKKGADNHHNSTGSYDSFGNKGAFKTIGNSSVGQYTKKPINVKTQR